MSFTNKNTKKKKKISKPIKPYQNINKKHFEVVVYKSPNENTFENYMSKLAVVVDRSGWINTISIFSLFESL